MSTLMFHWKVGKAWLGEGALHLAGSKASSALMDSFSGDTWYISLGVFGRSGGGTAQSDSKLMSNVYLTKCIMIFISAIRRHLDFI